MIEESESGRQGRSLLAAFGLSGKLMLSHLAVIAVAMTVVGVALLSLVRGYLLEALQGSLETQAELISNALLSGAGVEVQPPESGPAYNSLQQQQIANLAVQVENQFPGPQTGASSTLNLAQTSSIELSSALPTHILLQDSAGATIFESGMLGPAGLHRSAVIQAARNGDSGRSLLRSVDGDWLVIALPLRQEEKVVGALALAHPLSDMVAVLDDLRSRILIAAGIAALLSGGLGSILAGRLVRPIRQLTTAARRLGERDFAHPVPSEGRDEIATLGRTFASMRDALKLTERTRTQFISDVSHELRTPLSGIKGLVETLQDGAVEDPDIRDRFLASIDLETERLIRLTEDLLTLTRADEEALELEKTAQDLERLVNETINRLRPEAKKAGIRLELSGPQVPLTIQGDADRLEQVLINLLSNALKHAPSGTAVEVLITRISERELVDRFSASGETSRSDRGESHSTDGWALVRIRDQGPGIPPESLERIFDRFYRADRARDRDRGGSGLGLSIARALIQLHGGKLWVESPLSDWSGQGPPGTQASFALPCD